MTKTKIFTDKNMSYGASMTEVLLAMAIVAVATPFVYSQLTNANQMLTNMTIANSIISMRSPVLNFVRLNQDTWPDTAQIKLSDDELDGISEFPSAGFIDKYTVRGASKTDVYLAFDIDFDNLRVNKIARQIGADAAVVDDDGVAYGASWAVAAPDFKPGNLIYRISRDIAGEDKSIFLHRGASEDDGLNVMMRDLNMGGYDIYNIGTIIAKSIRMRNATATFVESENARATNVYFSGGASLNSEQANMGAMRVTGDINGFRNIYASVLNGRTYTTNGRVVTDRASISNSVNVSHDFVLKSSSSRTVSGFVAMSANSVLTPFLSVDEMIFYDKSGLTVSGELLMSTNAPLRIGSWTFPTTTPPQFREINFARSKIPQAPNAREFDAIMQDSWRDVSPVTDMTPTFSGDMK
ncbi:MAG: hypothetical protein NC311_04380 [Muribaculaceae bacterium]|nr:hypothetical protein [Muribaculaceae bacterium]